MAEPPEPPWPLIKPDLVGRWCGTPGEVLTLDADGGFEIEGASATFMDPLLYEDGYVDDYRVRTDFGGVRPTTVFGTWTIRHLPTRAAVSLSLKRIGGLEVNEGYGMNIAYTVSGYVLSYPSDIKDIDAEAPMRRCDATIPQPQPQRS